jgi:phosphatidylinositol alpha-1,6-mannosyltransferase
VDLLKLLPFFQLPESAQIVLFLHGIEVWRDLSKELQTLLKRVSLFLSNSLHTWQMFLKFQPGLADVPHVVTHLGVGEAVDEPEPAPHNPPVALMLGRMERNENYKGHRELIDAWPQVLAQMPEAQLWVVGDGNLRADLEARAADRHVNAAVRFFGEVSETQKLDLLKQARCLAMPSRKEGFGLVYLEAMRLGRPCQKT